MAQLIGRGMRHVIGGQIPQPVLAVGLLCGDVENIFLAAGELIAVGVQEFAVDAVFLAFFSVFQLF